MSKKSNDSKKASAVRAKKNDFYIVGIGGSAGSIEVLEQFFSSLAPDAGMAFVIVQHLDPHHKDIMPEILQRITSMKVCQAKDAMPVRPNRIYVIPPNKDMSLMHGKLHLLTPVTVKGIRMPIDFFFRSLAQDREERAIAVILSGMGTDGTLGIKEIKARLGMVMVQSLESAKYDGMPRSALDTGLVDYVAAAGELPGKLINYARYFTKVPREMSGISRHTHNTLRKIFLLLRNQTGHDFSFYKKNTVYRRIERRMNLHQLNTVAKYLRYLQINPQELELLFKELLIGVTNFFRDPEGFEALKEKGLPLLLKNRPKGSTMRAWVIGCSTGEEAYSLAIILREYLEAAKLSSDYRFQIFATDIDKDSVEKARAGIYPANISADVAAPRMHKYFTKEDDQYQVKKDIREMIVFAPQDLITDPPFTKLDLILCRNLLIYLTSELQKKLLPLFHYALNPSGLLFLGSAETVGSLNNLFVTVDGKWKIFTRTKQANTGPEMIEFPSTLLSAMHDKQPAPVEDGKRGAANISDLVNEKLLEIFGHPAVFINDNGEILYIHGRTGKYLEPASGRANMNIFAMAREEIRFDLTSAVRKAVVKKTDVTIHNLKVETNGGFERVNMIVKPFTKPADMEGIIMIAFEGIQEDKQENKPGRINTAPSKHKSGVAELEQELHYTKEYLHTTIEEMETSQEELKSANEELQSLNEEMVTVNAELQNKVDELTQTNNDMKNLLNSTELATIFLDNNLNVKRFTPEATKITNLIPSDVGRPIDHIVSRFKYDRMREDVNQVLATLIFREIEIEAVDHRWFLMRIIPYRTLDNVIDGVVITFSDISRLKELETALAEAREQLGKSGGKQKKRG